MYSVHSFMYIITLNGNYCLLIMKKAHKRKGRSTSAGRSLFSGLFPKNMNHFCGVEVSPWSEFRPGSSSQHPTSFILRSTSWRRERTKDTSGFIQKTTSLADPETLTLYIKGHWTPLRKTFWVPSVLGKESDMSNYDYLN